MNNHGPMSMSPGFIIFWNTHYLRGLHKGQSLDIGYKDTQYNLFLIVRQHKVLYFSLKSQVCNHTVSKRYQLLDEMC